MRKTYSFEDCAFSASRHLNRKAWAKAEGSLYQAAWRNGWLDTCCVHMAPLRKTWCENACVTSAKKYVEIRKWRKEEPKAYDAAASNGWLSKCTSHFLQIKKPNGYWTKDRCVSDAKLYSYRKQWFRNNAAAYKKAKQSGWLDECCAHMIAKRHTADTVYFWQAVGETYNGNNVYKIGITSSEIGLARVERCAKINKMQAELVYYAQFATPRKVERKLLGLGENPKLDVPDGRTEFRALSATQLQQVAKVFENSFAGIARA